MNTLRKPFFFIAIGLIACCVLVELGIGSLLDDAQAVRSEIQDSAREAGLGTIDPGTLNEANSIERSRPGLAIRYLALLDIIVLVTVGLMATGLYFPKSVHARAQAIASCIGSCLLILVCLGAIVLALLLLFLMIGLFLSAPFGTIAYLAIFGSFDVEGAAITLALLMLLKLGFVGFLIAANQGFLLSKGLVLIILSSLVANVIVSILHGFPPGVLVSITDSIAAIVVAIIAIVWAIVVLVGAIMAIVRGLKVA